MIQGQLRMGVRATIYAALTMCMITTMIMIITIHYHAHRDHHIMGIIMFIMDMIIVIIMA